MASVPPLRYLVAADVGAAMPALPERLRLAELTLTALATPGAAELPPKLGVHLPEAGAFAHAMPAHLRGRDGRGDLVGLKWVAGSGGNRARGLPAIHALVVLNDPGTLVPVAILDGAPITAERTAAVSGVAIARMAAPRSPSRPRAAIIGAGVQARSHLPVLGHLLPGVEVVIHDRHPERATAVAAHARDVPGIGRATTAETARHATDGADVVVTAVSFTDPAHRQTMTPDWLAPEALVVAVDYATMCSAAVADDAALFLVDQRAQFLANRDAGEFDGYRDPDALIGEVVVDRTARPAGRVLVTHLGVGLADVVFAAAILERAAAAGLGRTLPR